ncbi:MAG: hypothetical protein ABR555_10285 [Pyrinomonadaceae bacterium]
MRFKLTLLLALLIPISAAAQTPEDATRRLWDTAFIVAPAKKHAVKRRAPARAYRVATPAVPIDKVDPNNVVGVTIWRLRTASPTDAGERLIVHEHNVDKEWVPQRIAAGTRLAQGDRVRVSIEAARTGYLYVIDREQYADGTLGEPYLIFPTTRTLGGDNKLSIGRLVEIPAQDDNPPYFTVKRSRPNHIAEVLSVLVTPEPLEGIQIGEQAQKLAESQVASWEKSWSTRVGRLEMQNTVGQSWTKEERDAGGENTRALTATGPAPQLLFYRPGAKASDPIFVQLRLLYEGAGKRTSQ